MCTHIYIQYIFIIHTYIYITFLLYIHIHVFLYIFSSLAVYVVLTYCCNSENFKIQNGKVSMKVFTLEN